MSLETDRLILRQWKKNDFNSFAEMNSDAETMEYFPSTLTRKESDSMAKKCKALIDQNGWGYWAVQLKSNAKFVGFVGLHRPNDHFPFSPCIEIGWRLLKCHWGKGYATEAATEVLNHSFNDLSIKEIISFTSSKNHRSKSVMKRIGMVNTGRNFNHPDLPKDHALSNQVLYKITQSQWLKFKKTNESEIVMNGCQSPL
jgi:RimJ/RimL family protein N-acetyltransferase